MARLDRGMHKFKQTRARAASSSGKILRGLCYSGATILLCSIGVSCASPSGGTQSSLEVALAVRDCDAVGEMLAEGANPNLPLNDPMGTTPLMMAVARDDVPSMLCIMRELIDHGADVNATNTVGETALMWASQWGRAEYIELLLAAGADVNQVDVLEQTALDRALSNGHEEVVALLESASKSMGRSE